MKQIVKIFSVCVFASLLLFDKGYAQNNSTSPDTSMDIRATYSLFSEYYKNKDFKSALPYGWTVLKKEPKQFAKWIYFKMEDILWYTHDSLKISPEQTKAIEDTMPYFYDMAIKYDTSDKGYFEARKAFVSEEWLKTSPDTIIAMYEKAIKDDPSISTYYYDRLGELYKNNASAANGYKLKAIDLYTALSEKQPDNQQWPEKLEGLVDNIDELVKINKRAWDLDKENLEKAYKYASVAMKAQKYKEAIEALEFLVKKSPDTPNYWMQLASAYTKIDDLDNAINAYNNLIKLEPNKKEDYLNLGIVYKDKGQLAKARELFLKASEVGKGWGLAIYDEGLLYEQAARGCDFNFETKLVYQLAVDTYRRAYSLDPNLSQAKERIPALSGSVPTKEDYFFRGYKSGKVLPITGSCYGWINRSVTVP